MAVIKHSGAINDIVQGDTQLVFAHIKAMSSRPLTKAEKRL